MPVCITIYTPKVSPYAAVQSPYGVFCFQPVVADKSFMDGTAYVFMDGEVFEFN